ncbi:GTP-binding protein RAD isoform X1 [Terrapene carolina triunguis]|uniref:GTP-binding protein n=2 Tax=Terrapene triunguis TaxID=2587831 RepID=A0A674KIN2_9SAUR|nr:GTP-binding protein RAD isoform X1 [Terrapene carolina triunguis]
MRSLTPPGSLSPQLGAPMTLNRGDKLRYLEKRRCSTPFAAHQHLHRRSMPVDARELQASVPPGELLGEFSPLGRCTSYNPDRESWASDSSDSVISSGSDSDSNLYKVILLGEHGVGKTSLARIFGGVEDCPDAEEAGNTYNRSIIVDGEEASLIVFDIWEQDDSQWLQNHCMKMGDAYIIVYSVTDKVSFEKASELRIQLRRARQTEDIPIILVGNKSDLVRSREVSVDEGRACAVVFDCKFIETSAALHHNVKDLFEGIIRQIRLRKDSKEDNARRMANTKRRESISKKAKRFLGRIVAKNNKKMAFKAKSKSCHDLSVL